MALKRPSPPDGSVAPDGRIKRMNVISHTNSKKITKEMASEEIDFLVESLSSTDGVTSHLSSDEMNTGVKILEELKKFYSRQGALIDEMRGAIRRLEANLETLQARFDASVMRADAAERRADAAERRADTWEMSAVNTSALIKAFDLISLFRKYHLSQYDWNDVTKEYKTITDNVENRLISTDDFYKSKAIFNAKYLSICVKNDMTQHILAKLKRLLNKKNFLMSVKSFLTHIASKVCIPLLQKMLDLKNAEQLRRID
jgi:outer membrane murein-binding lipoprotein Lpp